ncbi:hypothetical protein H257_15331 [Aphanomyces astaci]|uniref:Uncharacterized protein n=1 Tax=Aphanomyces astaci TaxID=112090 RepID=W4FP82_APHAT|nr:hypothetical protein H257_15331 [Aphanomyces astaci]ETV68746.1 hypothetical protein H257_15331 [Aphanomyces astaci]|eukprot:XP_009841700.1 hypothetical protein H257_15331 [Aphanomyces astaci]
MPGVCALRRNQYYPENPHELQRMHQNQQKALNTSNDPTREANPKHATHHPKPTPTGDSGAHTTKTPQQNHQPIPHLSNQHNNDKAAHRHKTHEQLHHSTQIKNNNPPEPSAHHRQQTTNPEDRHPDPKPIHDTEKHKAARETLTNINVERNEGTHQDEHRDNNQPLPANILNDKMTTHNDNPSANHNQQHRRNTNQDINGEPDQEKIVDARDQISPQVHLQATAGTQEQKTQTPHAQAASPKQ